MDAQFQLEQPALGHVSGEREAGEPTEGRCPRQWGGHSFDACVQEENVTGRRPTASRAQHMGRKRG